MPLPRLPGGIILVLLVVLTQRDAGAEDLDRELLQQLLQEVATLRAKVAELEKALIASETTKSPADKPVTAATVPPAAPAALSPRPAIQLGGRLKLDVIANSRSVGGPGGSNDGDLAIDPGAVPLSGSGESGQTSFSAHGARLWLKGAQPTPFGDIAALVEVDFFGSGAHNERVSNSYAPRLRHGYGEWRGWTAGQTFTTFMNASAIPELNDDGIVAGVVLVRQPLIRKRMRFGDSFLDVALESPETTLTAPDGSRLAPDDDRLPDWIVRYGANGAFGNITVAAMLREIRTDDALGVGVDDEALGYAASASGRIRVGTYDDFRFSLTGGNAVGRYMTGNAFNAARFDGRRLALTDTAGGFAAYQHWWSARWRSTAAAGFAWQDGGASVGTENEWLGTVHMNLMFSPVPSTTLGIEWAHAWRRRFDDREGHLNRLQFTILHNL